MDIFLLGNDIPQNRQLGITEGNGIILNRFHVLFHVPSLPVFTGRLIWQHMQPTVGSVPVSPRGGGPAV